MKFPDEMKRAPDVAIKTAADSTKTLLPNLSDVRPTGMRSIHEVMFEMKNRRPISEELVFRLSTNSGSSKPPVEKPNNVRNATK